MKFSIMVLPVLSITLATVNGDQNEKRLYRYLKGQLDKLERPVQNAAEALNVTLSITLNQIIGLDEKNQILTINAWLNYAWNDYKLSWNESDYGSITAVRFPCNDVWRPDVLMYNSVDTSFDSTYPSNVVVYNDGSMNWIPPGIFAIACKVDIAYFPWDEQLCFMKFGSWTYDGTKLNLMPANPGFDFSEYMVNGEWNLIESYVNRTEMFYDCCPDAPYVDVKFFIRMQRRVLYYAVNLIVPNTAITFMTLLGFLLPVEAFEKITLQVTVLLSICVFLNIVASIMPPTSEAIPLVGVFFLMCLVLNSASCVFTVLIINLHLRNPDTHMMGKWTKIIFLNYLPWVLMMQRPDHDFSWKSMPPLTSPKFDTNSESLMRNVREDDEYAMERTRHNSLDLEQKIRMCLKQLSANPTSMSSGQSAEILALQRICEQLKAITTSMNENDEWEDVVGDWQFIATVVDRLCLWLMLLAINVSIAYILFKAPYIYA